MKILLPWLKDYVEFDASAEKLADDLHMAGVAVEGIEDAENGAGKVLELEITTNRPDLLSYYGVAREVAALYEKPLKKIEPKLKEAQEEAASAATIEIAEPELCHRYAGLVLRGVKVAPSPGWLKKRLEACGVQSINNLVDVSNYVLFELGHPTHAFDLDKLNQKKIIVRRAKKGELITTLDGVKRTLEPSNLVIADAQDPVALAGIMGGEDSEIGFSTKNVLIESAWFEPVITRRAGKRMGLRTEASYRFERGMDVEAPLRAAHRCAELILELAGGELLRGAIDVYPTKWECPQVELRRSEIVRHLGMPVPDNAVEHILSTLGFEITGNKNGWKITVPSWRRDVFREIDVIEEIARLHGYDKFPSRIPPLSQPVTPPPCREAEEALRQRLEAQGFDEAVTFSLVNPDEAEKFKAPEETLAPIANPLSREVSVLRPTGLLSLVQALSRNINRGRRNLRLYEIGHAYSVREGKFNERRTLTLAATGKLREKGVHQEAHPFDLFALKGTIEAALEIFALPPINYGECSSSVFPPGESTAVLAGDKQLGVAGKLVSALMQQFKLRQDAYLAEFDLDALYAAGLRPRHYQKLSRYPAVERDFSLLVNHDVTFGQVRAAIEALKIPELQTIAAVDRFEGKSLPEDKYSLLVRATFQSQDQTLKEEEVRGFTEKILTALEKETGATIRV